MARTERIAAVALAAALVAGLLAVVAWRESQGRPPAEGETASGSGEWLKGTPAQKLGTVEKQLRGLDVAMAEIGYRFTELHFAGQDRNWDYAKYQAEKIDLALRLALERRPKRAASSQPFLNETLPAVQKAIAGREAGAFQEAMDHMRTACMKCHTDEKVPYFTVEFPEHRLSPVRSVR